MVVTYMSNPSSFILTDEFDGRTIALVPFRISTRKLARQFAAKTANASYDGFYLVELKDGGVREIVRHYNPHAAR